MATRMLVRSQYHNPDESGGKCPHCGKSVSIYRSGKACEHCGNPIAWEWNELSVWEVSNEKERLGEENEKAKMESPIKPCPFCGQLVGFPSIEISKTEKPYLYLSIGCFACGIHLTEISFKSEMESLGKANEALIKKWNTRWKDEQ